MEGSVPGFKEEPFCHSFGTPARNEADVDDVLNEIIADKKKGDREFFLQTTPT